MIRKTISLIILTGVLVLPVYSKIFFKGTDQQLEVIRVKGEEPGLTLLIFGGIHGDEPGGYFSCELLEKITLTRGSLIIVPRVNFPAIMVNRRELNGDMNRKFIENLNKNNPDYKKVEILKKLMEEADIFVNQHDASGFHRNSYQNSLYNPLKYGQSLIVDGPEFFSKRLNRKVDLESLGNRIVRNVNLKIKEKKHHFCFWNHNSVDLDTKFESMKKSATYYALTKFSIPAFGLETSKDLPNLFAKVKYQMLMIGEILNEFGFEYKFPKIEVKHPKTYWVELKKNNRDVIRVNPFTNIRLKISDEVVVTGIFSNYNNGLSVNILGFSTLYDMGKVFPFKGKPTTINLMKNNHLMGRIYLKRFQKNSIRSIELKVGEKTVRVPNWGVLQISKGMSFKISGYQPASLNFLFDVRGYSKRPNRRDDSGVEIFYKDLIRRYSFSDEGKIFFTKISLNSKLAGGFQIEYAD